MGLPDFLVKKTPKQENIRRIRSLLDDATLHTVCEEARCPNIGECFSQNTLTFMLLGDICTRNCRFCGVNQGDPLPVDPEEPERITSAVNKLNLNYVVITSVTRDDLADGGAQSFVNLIIRLKNSNPRQQIEVLIPDFKGNLDSLKKILAAQPLVLNHNLETIQRLYPFIRPQADYQRSLNILRQSKEINSTVYTKSGFMVGLGETREEIFALLEDLKAANCDMVTIGQYLAPSKDHLQPQRYVDPEEFEAYEKAGKALGFMEVFSGPFVRSSYRAAEIIRWKNHNVY